MVNWCCCFQNHNNSTNGGSQGQVSGSNPAAQNESTGDIPVFEHRVLVVATDNFATTIRQGHFGPVFSGILSNVGVAVKRVDRSQQQFDILALSSLRHPNVVSFTGFCSHGQQLLLVYRNRRSLSNHIHVLPTGQQPQPLDWNTRMEIILGIAKGIGYLHRSNLACIELKSSNILLGEGYVPIISEFGLPMLPETRFSVAPNSESDVYSFGEVLLEIVSGRKVSDQMAQGVNFLMWAKDTLNDINERTVFQALADTRLPWGYPKEALRYVLDIARRCLDRATNRPTMEQIISDLTILKENGPPDTDIHRHGSRSQNEGIRIGSSSTSARPSTEGIRIVCPSTSARPSTEGMD